MTDLAAIYAKLPHAGSMCLIDEVLEWDREAIVCATTSHRSATNPLRRADALGSTHAVEYAAQAAAVHGVLYGVLDGGPVLLLAAVRDLRLPVARLDTLTGPLIVDARLRGRSGVNAIYDFSVQSAGTLCASGALTLMQGGEEVQ